MYDFGDIVLLYVYCILPYFFFFFDKDILTYRCIVLFYIEGIKKKFIEF